jgi:hypothetical protein
LLFEETQKLEPALFVRLTGVKRSTFESMVEILKDAEAVKKAKGGRPNNLGIENRLLLTLSYWREYRTYFHIAGDFQISEATCFRTVRWVENCLVKSRRFALPGRKSLQGMTEQDVVLIDATESPIERPKKSRSIITQEKRSAIP